MIDSKESLRRYLEQDRLALNRQQDKGPRLFHDEIWRFEILLRKVEYDINCRSGMLSADFRAGRHFFLRYDKRQISVRIFRTEQHPL